MSTDNRIEKKYLVDITEAVIEQPSLKLSVDYSVVTEWIAANTVGEYVPDKHDWIEAPVNEGGAGYPQGGKVNNVKKNDLGVLTMYYTTNYVKGSQGSVNRTPTKGWDSGGISVDGFEGDGYFEFHATSIPRRIVAGVTGKGTPYESMRTTDATHAFYLFKHATDSGEVKYLVRVLENGEYPTKPSAPKPQFQASSGMVYRIMRVGEEITYLLFSHYGQRLYAYKSAQKSQGKLFLDVSLWRSGDYITQPVMVTPESDAVLWGEALNAADGAAVIAGVIPAMAAIASSGVYREVRAMMPEIQSSLTFIQFGQVYADIPAMQCVVTDIFQRRITASLPEMTGSAFLPVSNYEPPPEFGIDAAMMVTGAILFRPSNPFVIDTSLPAIVAAMAPSGYFSIAGSIAAMQLSLNDGSADDTATMKNVYSGDTLCLATLFYTDPIIYASLGSDIEFGFNGADTMYLDVTIVIDKEQSETLGMDTATEFSRTIMEMINSGAVFGGMIADQDIQDIQYAVNSATTALSTYRNFNFESFAKTDNGTYGVRNGCIYKIRNGDDDGFMRDHTIDFGDTDFGSAIKKNVDSIYFEIDTDGDGVIAKVSGDNGEVYSYQVTQYGQTSRAILGRGNIAKVWSLRLDIQGAKELTLDAVEYSVAMPAQSGRRLK